MKTSYLYAFIALFAIALVFGCITNTGSNQTNQSTGGLTVTPTQVVASGPVTIQYMLINNYENNMEDVRISLLNVPSTYEVEKSVITTPIIAPTQQYPAVFVIKTDPGISLKQTISPKLEVCYNYSTNYYFDTVLKTTSIATETAPTESGYSTGPISVTQMGLDSVFTDTDLKTYTGSLKITNTGNGKITKIKMLNIDESIGSTNIDDVKLAYSTCGGTEGSASLAGRVIGITGMSSGPPITIPVVPVCDVFNNTLAIQNGLTATVKMKTTTEAAGITSATPERIEGQVEFTYCYELPVGTITVCPAGKTC